VADDYRVTLRVGAGLDTRSFDATFGEAQSRAKRAAQAISKTTIDADRSAGKARVESARSAEKEIAAVSRAQLATQRAAMRQFNEEWKRDRRAAYQEETREARAAAQVKRQLQSEERRAEQASQRERERFASRTSYRATRFLFPAPAGMLGYGARVGRDVLRGVGMDWSLAASLERNRSNETLANQISNQGWVPGEGDFDKRISTERVRANSQAVGRKYAYGEGEVSEATQTYINLTGDLKGALPLMDKLALLSRATGTSMSDAAQAAADMSVQFEGMPDKGKRVADMLGIAAMQGKTGALELFQIAKQMPRIVSQAGFFAGDRSTSMGNLLAATQITRRYGGAGTPAQAATVVQSVVAAIEKGGKAFGKAGVDTRDKSGSLLALPTIIANSIKASYSKGGKFDADKFFGMWNAIRGGKLAMGAKTLYDRAGGGQSGVDAVIAEFSKFTRGLKSEDLKKLAGSAVSTQDRQAQLFQSQMDKVGREMQSELLPALNELAPQAVKLAQAWGGLITFTAHHLPTAIAGAFTLAVGRAFAESMLRRGIDRMLAGRPTIGGVKGMAGGVLSGPGMKGAAISPVSIVNYALVAAAIGAAVVGAITELANMRNANATKTLADTKTDEGLFGGAAKEKADKLQEELDKQIADNFGGEGDSAWTRGSKKTWGAIKWMAGVGDDEDMAVKHQRITTLRGRQNWSDQSESGLHFGRSFEGDVQRRQKADAASAEDIGAQVADQLGNKILAVRLTNPSDIKLTPKTVVDPKGRDKSPGDREP
jgi:hypothetical protein